MAEAAGLVLAVIPLLISAVEDYQVCFEVLGRWRNFTREYRICRTRLQRIQLEFTLLIEKLLGGEVDEQELKVLTTRATEKDWERVDVHLRQRLRAEVYQTFTVLMKDMEHAVGGLSKELGCDRVMFQKHISHLAGGHEEVTSTCPGVDHRPAKRRKWYANFREHVQDTHPKATAKASYEAQRLKFSIGGDKRNQLFDEIDQYIVVLDRLLSKNDESRAAISRHQAARALTEFWRHAHNVFQLLARSWICTCRALHRTDLLLLHREVSIAAQFEVSFRYGSALQMTTPLPWTSYTARIQETKIDSPQTAKQGVQSPIGKHVGFSISGSHSTSSMRAAMASSSTGQALLAQSAAHSSCSPGQSLVIGVPTVDEPALNLCSTLSACRDQACTNILAAKEIDAEYLMESAPSTSLGPVGLASLKELLQSTHHRLNRKQRYIIALAIASSHIQLHSSAWLRNRWSATDIVFEVHNGKVEVNRPLLRANSLTDAGKNERDQVRRDDTFASLGIILLELCFGCNLEDCPHRPEYRFAGGFTNFVMDSALALRWADDVEGESGEEYASAVWWCLRTRLPKDKAWRQEFHAEVVERLAAVCANF